MELLSYRAIRAIFSFGHLTKILVFTTTQVPCNSVVCSWSLHRIVLLGTNSDFILRILDAKFMGSPLLLHYVQQPQNH